MNLITIFSLYPDQEACIEHLETVRWHGEPSCPHCGSVAVARKAERHRIGRWNCRGCKSSFNVMSGTIFEKTKVELQKWFLAVGLVVHAKKSLSSASTGPRSRPEPENSMVHAAAHPGRDGCGSSTDAARHRRGGRDLCWREAS